MLDYQQNINTQRFNSFSGSPLYHLQSVSVQFGHVRALENIELVVNEREILFLTGASGAGKTTLINVIAGDLKNIKGNVLTPDHFAKDVFTSRVFQDGRLFEDLTIEQNLLYSYDSAVYKNKDMFTSDLLEYAKYLDIKDRLGLKVKDINGGLAQKVALLRSVMACPDMILADEPTCSLDLANARKVYDLLNLLNVKKGLTVVWATHNKELVKSFSGRMVHLDRGKVIYSGHACFI